MGFLDRDLGLIVAGQQFKDHRAESGTTGQWPSAGVARPDPPVLWPIEMVCYVDAVRSYPTAGLRFREYCHLLADSREELHAMADQLGMPRQFFQEHPWRWHYDLPEHMRTEAVRLGAREMSMHEVGALLRARRARLPADA